MVMHQMFMDVGNVINFVLKILNVFFQVFVNVKKVLKVMVQLNVMQFYQKF